MGTFKGVDTSKKKFNLFILPSLISLFLCLLQHIEILPHNIPTITKYQGYVEPIFYEFKNIQAFIKSFFLNNFIIYIIIFGFKFVEKGKEKWAEVMLICPKCEHVVNSNEKRDLKKCEKCGCEMVSLKGYYKNND